MLLEYLSVVSSDKKYFACLEIVKLAKLVSYQVSDRFSF